MHTFPHTHTQHVCIMYIYILVCVVRWKIYFDKSANKLGNVQELYIFFNQYLYSTILKSLFILYHFCKWTFGHFIMKNLQICIASLYNMGIVLRENKYLVLYALFLKKYTTMVLGHTNIGPSTSQTASMSVTPNCIDR